jgi:hypothetical protein
MNWISLLIEVIIGVIIISPILWLVGRGLVGKQKAKFTDAIWIVALGLIVGGVLGAFIHGFVGAVVSFIVWLGLIKHFFDCGWLKAFLIAIVAFIVLIIIAVVLGLLLGVGVLSLLGVGAIPGI